MLFIYVRHPFSIVLKRFYCSQEVLSKIPKPIENNRKWVWLVYKCDKDKLGVLDKIFEVFTSANKVIFQNYFANKLIKWFDFEAVQNPDMFYLSYKCELYLFKFDQTLV